MGTHKMAIKVLNFSAPLLGLVVWEHGKRQQVTSAVEGRHRYTHSLLNSTRLCVREAMVLCLTRTTMELTNKGRATSAPSNGRSPAH
ncbi:uncharacterized protein TNIN_173371 [Trichonephila inaurata madagascariensis]|uniref:Secreted protein n=1 Tax=Trichonephila inaurata madagascariensis TaxID=2747483 RepID=A0A8X6YXM7_9ARAC|nr:uncharacterized protein TNIN_173371 [Trichonephila inaurata madagascariensis]